MIITVTLQLGRGFQPVKVPTKSFYGVKLSDDGQSSLVCAALCAYRNKGRGVSGASRGGERRKWCRLALCVVIECPVLAVRVISKKGSVRDFADDNFLPSVLQGVLATRCRWSSLLGRRLLTCLGFGLRRISSLWRHRGRRSR